MKREEVFIPGNVYYKGYTREGALASVGEGWANLINIVFDKVQTYTPGIIIHQVKEKWGGLRIYCGPCPDDFDKFLIEIEKKSFTMCESCGKAGQLRSGGWYRTLCDEHANGREPINPF
jgi:hypothetical protein